MTGRDVEIERVLLDTVEQTVDGSRDFCKLVRARLADGDREHGDTFQKRAASALVVEAGEESLDLVAWSALALTVAERSGMDRRDLDRVRADLQCAAIASATAFRHIGQAIGVLIAAEAQQEPRP